MILRAKFHVVSILLSDFDAIVTVALPLKVKLKTENENMVNLISDSFVVIILLHEGLTHIHSQKKPSCILARVLL